MQFQILGPLEVHSSGRPVRIAGHRQRKALALLLLNANMAVSTERLVDMLWDDPPRSARQQVHNVISGLRRALLAPSQDVSVVTTDTGYQMNLPPDRLDAQCFQRDLRAAERAEASGHPRRAARLLGDAVALWRGPALTGLDGQHITSVATRLNEQRLAATEQRMALRLRLGEAGSLVSDLLELVAEHPLRESLRHSLMLALYHSGRQADALSVYEQGRRLLAEELGLDPGPELRRLHELVLTGGGYADQPEPPDGHRPNSAGPARADGDTGGRHRPAPNTLPYDTGDFTGRSAEVATLLAGAATSRAALTILTIDGMGGAGKTTLAVHVAHRLAADYPDGQHFIDLHGFSSGLDPLTPARALDILLEGSGTPPELVPSSLSGKSALWRSRMAGRRALLILDNAKDPAQVRPLLPGAAGVLVLVTSRRRLTGLEGAMPLSLDVLPHSEAVDLFVRIAGHDRATGDPDAVDSAVQLCGRLPLAIRIAAARLRDRTAWTVTDLVNRLHTQQQRTRFLEVDDRGVSATLALSHRYLAAGQRSLLRLLSLHPGEDFDAAAAAALAGIPLDEVETHLESLFEANLLLRTTAERFGFHDLIRDCAGALLVEHTDAATRHAARHRLLDYYLHAARVWSTTMALGAFRFVPDVIHVPAHVAAVKSDDEGIALLRAEYRNLVAAARFAAEHGWHAHAWQLPAALQPFLKLQNYGGDSLALFEGALRAARTLGDTRGESAALTGLALVRRERGSSTTARTLLEQAIEISRERGDNYAEAFQLADLRIVHARNEQILECYESLRLEVATMTAEQPTYAAMVHNLGVVCMDLGRYDEALGHFRYVMSRHAKRDSPLWKALTLSSIGMLYHLRGRYHDAIATFEEVLAISRPRHFAQGETLAMVGACTTYRSVGRLAEALEYGRDALNLARKFGLGELEGDALDALGETLLSIGDLDNAELTFGEAMEFATRHGFGRYAARALEGLAHVSLARGDLASARSHWERALSRHPAGLVDAQNARRHLSALGRTGVLCARCVVERSEDTDGAAAVVNGSRSEPSF